MVVLDQRRLPDEEVELRCASAAEVADAIRTLAVRGAPAIGVAAAYGLALAAERGEDLDAAYEVLASSRPTAVNLRWALDELRDDPTPERARALHDAEVERCRRWRAHAVELLAPGLPGPHPLQHRRARDRRATGPRSERFAPRSRPVSSSTCGSTRRGRCSRARGSPPGSSTRSGSRSP